MKADRPSRAVQGVHFRSRMAAGIGPQTNGHVATIAACVQRLRVYNVAPQCLPKQQQSTLKQFLALYKAAVCRRDMLADALANATDSSTGSPLIRCNDLALASAMQRLNACLQTNSLPPRWRRKESGILVCYATTTTVATAKATWHNQKLCGKPGPWYDAVLPLNHLETHPRTPSIRLTRFVGRRCCWATWRRATFRLRRISTYAGRAFARDGAASAF